ncbi:MAG TPA: hypothetical protein VEL68_06590 [Thermodesulfobacteriota bacterium]|nr:hypothetical protein [Thermodesulfobacteriota bacterium]
MIPFFVLLILGFLLGAPHAWAESLEERIKKLEETIQKQQEVLKEQQKALEDLKEQSKQAKVAEPLPAAPAPPRDYRLDDRSRGIYVPTASPLTPYSLTKQSATPGLMNPAISLILDTEYYHSSLSKAELQSRSTPGFIGPQDPPFDEGFNLRSAELAFFAPVDPYFNLYATLPVTENGVELEEAYFVTTSLPAGLQVKGGKFKSGFGRFNAFHPHAWDFVDAPIPYKLFFGGDGEGLIEKGAQLTYLPNLPIYTILGAEVLQGENDTLFGPDGGPHAYTGFVKSSLDFGANQSILFGGSVVGGKTNTTSFAPNTLFQGTSVLYGLEFTYKWKPSRWRSFVLQSEYLYRHQKGDLTDTVALTKDSLKRNQDGFYAQALFQIDRWRIGARFDRMAIFKDEVIRAGEKQNYSGQPYRWTGSLEFNPTEFSRVRLQYNYDQSDPNKLNQEIFLQFLLAVGAHGAHAY